MKVFCSWSGGKDSCLSCYKAMIAGHEVDLLFTMLNSSGRHSRSHNLPKEVILAQAEAIGIPVYYKLASWNTYEREFRKALASMHQRGFEGGVFGDLHLEEGREWVEKVCALHGTTPLLPLWKVEAEDVLLQLLEHDFEAVVIGVREERLGTHWLGRTIDKGFIAELGEESVDLCGEQGEYHTLVVDGPIFKKRLQITDTKVIRNNGVSFLEILGFELKDKSDEV